MTYYKRLTGGLVHVFYSVGQPEGRYYMTCNSLHLLL